LRATYLDVKRRLETYVPSTECPPVSSPPPKLTQECQKSPVSKTGKSLTKQDNWNQVALAKVASTHKFTDFLKSRDLRMLSKSCSLVAVDTYEQYFTSLSGAILLYLSAKITEKYVKENYGITEQKEIDKIRLGLVHCFGLPKQ